ncbi:MAG: YlxR family protein [Anaeroplasma sp.]|uniref:RNase P modulator RnpM n=1 Tax=Anaeroplasma sp. TaxID=1872523 RepID=UPI002A90B29D|nr:YlxR family protein [Anaeroplasma sp.]MDY5982186.1 YlxR family protein [Anaeroplasma sp.]
MKERKPVLRTCVVTKEVCEKKDLIRVVRTPEGNVIVDTKGKANGRGAYLKLMKEVILKAKASKALDKKLEVSVPDTIYDELLGLLK